MPIDSGRSDPLDRCQNFGKNVFRCISFLSWGGGPVFEIMLVLCEDSIAACRTVEIVIGDFGSAALSAVMTLPAARSDLISSIALPISAPLPSWSRLRSRSACRANNKGWSYCGGDGDCGPFVLAAGASFPDAEFLDGLPLCASRRTPMTNSRPSLRQFLATAENCSRCHRMVTTEPTATGRVSRTQAPDFDLSSSTAGAWQCCPLASSQLISATAHISMRASISRPSMPDVSANPQRSLVTLGDTRSTKPRTHWSAERPLASHDLLRVDDVPMGRPTHRFLDLLQIRKS